MADPSEPPTPSAQVLIVDDEPDHAEVMAEALRRHNHVCTTVHGAAAARDELRHGQFDLVVTDLVMENDTDGMDILAEARQSQPDAETIMVTAHGDVPTAKAAIRGGAYDFIEKPLDLDVFRNLCDRAIQAVMLRGQNSDLREQLDEQHGFEGVIGTSPAIRHVISTMRQIAPSHLPVLISGGSGTGKELIAKALHNNSKRSGKQFVPLNCAGLSESILEDELFGHVRGAFTGAERERQGRFEYADGGTLFLDEVGDMPLTMQAKLLRVLESGEVVRLGANDTRHVDVRLISATNRDLSALAREGKFREDLFFRIKGVELHLPSLRERREDIPLLVRHFVRKFAEQLDKPAPTVAEDVMMILMRHDWPGNVRQLMNVAQNMVVIAEGDRIEPRHLPPEVRQGAAASTTARSAAPAAAGGGEGDDGQLTTPDVEAAGGGAAGGASGAGVFSEGMSLNQIEKQAIRNTLRITQGNREQAAQMLGIGERTLYRKLKEYGLK